MISDQTEIEVAWLEAVLNKQIYDQSVSKILKVGSASCVPKGENYASQIFRVKIELILGSGNRTKKSFILKRLPQSEDTMKVLEEFSVFQRETKMYCEVLPHFERIMAEYEDPNDKLWCTFISHKPYTEILLEDLKQQGYLVGNRKMCLSVKHGRLVMHSLARFHGISHVLLKRGVLNKNDLSKHFIETGSLTMKRIAQGGFKMLAEVMDKHWPPEWKAASLRIAKLVDVARDRLVHILNERPGNPFLVLNHGDCWICNMMFKYSPYEEDTPIGMRFLDFQGSSYNSYIVDILNFLYTSITGEDRRQNMILFLEEYHKSLVATLTFYGMQEVAPSMEHIHSELERTKFLSVFFGLIFYACTVSESNEQFDIEKLGSDCDAKDVFNPEIFKSEKYRLAVGPDIKQWMEDGII